MPTNNGASLEEVISDYTTSRLQYLKDKNFSEDYISGFLEGMEFILASYKMFKILDDNRIKYIGEEHAKRKS